MDLKLTRIDKNSSGIFSTLSRISVIAHTLEHAYEQPDGSYEAKIPPGTYSCVRGQHRLNGMSSDFTTFEVTGVSGHSNLLFHWGNYDKDSEGCVLLGDARVGIMVTNSRATFAKFMELQSGVDTFQLVVE